VRGSGMVTRLAAEIYLGFLSATSGGGVASRGKLS
jgi:hypothetical protein